MASLFYCSLKTVVAMLQFSFGEANRNARTGNRSGD
jgi:hypothetical protein